MQLSKEIHRESLAQRQVDGRALCWHFTRKSYTTGQHLRRDLSWLNIQTSKCVSQYVMAPYHNVSCLALRHSPKALQSLYARPPEVADNRSPNQSENLLRCSNWAGRMDTTNSRRPHCLTSLIRASGAHSIFLIKVELVGLGQHVRLP